MVGGAGGPSRSGRSWCGAPSTPAAPRPFRPMQTRRSWPRSRWKRGIFCRWSSAPKGGDHICDTTIVELADRRSRRQGAGLESDARMWWTASTRAIHTPTLPAMPAYGISTPPRPWSKPPFRLESNARTAKEFLKELAARSLQDDPATRTRASRADVGRGRRRDVSGQDLCRRSRSRSSNRR